jgi:hypothetical protein
VAFLNQTVVGPFFDINMASILYLPQELIEKVVDTVSKDRQTLQCLALAHGIFYPRARSHLFSTIHVRVHHKEPSSALRQRLRERLDSNPELYQDARELALYDQWGHLPDVLGRAGLDIIGRLNDLCELDAIHFVSFPRLDVGRTALLYKLQLHLQIITRLRLSRCSFVTGDGLLLLLSETPSLVSLRFDGLQIHNQEAFLTRNVNLDWLESLDITERSGRTFPISSPLLAQVTFPGLRMPALKTLAVRTQRCIDLEPMLASLHHVEHLTIVALSSPQHMMTHNAISSWMLGEYAKQCLKNY